MILEMVFLFFFSIRGIFLLYLIGYVRMCIAVVRHHHCQWSNNDQLVLIFHITVVRISTTTTHIVRTIQSTYTHHRLSGRVYSAVYTQFTSTHRTRTKVQKYHRARKRFSCVGRLIVRRTSFVVFSPSIMCVIYFAFL